MKFYEVITDACANDVTVRNDPPPPRLSKHVVTLFENEVTDLINEGLWFFMCAEASIV
jgi:hypothetical protein